MSLTRAIWNDGQGLATPDLQRPCDVAGSADDRVLDVLATPNLVQKGLVPLGSAANPRLLAIPSTNALSPAGVNGAVRLMPCELVAGSPSDVQTVALAANLKSPLDTPAIASNTSGSTRYDLVYATVNRAVSVTGTRKIKSATDGSLSSQSINLADAAAVALSVNQGFLTGATPPTNAQILAATPADTAPSSSTFGSFNFPVGYVTVANGYASGTTLFQDSSGGSTYITQCWQGAYVHHQRVRGPRPASIYYGSANERASTSVLANGFQGGERWGGGLAQFFAHFKVLPTTGTTVGTGFVVDNTIDWRHRFVWGFYAYLGSATVLPVEGNANPLAAGTQGVVNTNQAYNQGVLQPFWTGGGSTSGSVAGQMVLGYTDGATFAHPNAAVLNTDGSLRLFNHNSVVVDGTNGDALALVVFATDQLPLSF